MTSELNLYVTILTILLIIIGNYGVIIALRLAHIYYKNGVELVLFIFLNLVFLFGSAGSNYARIVYDIELNSSLNSLLFFISFIGTILASFFIFLMYLRIKNIEKRTYFYSKADKISFIFTTLGISMILIFSPFGYNQIMFTPSFFIISLNFTDKVLIGVALFLFSSYILIESKKLRNQVAKFKKPLNKQIQIIIYSIVQIFGANLILLIWDEILNYLLCYFNVLIGLIVFGYVIIRNPHIFDILSTYYDLNKIYIIYQNGICLYEQSFLMEELDKPVDSLMTSAMIFTIIEALKGMIKSEKNVRKIEFSGLKVIFIVGKFVIGALITFKATKFLKNSLEQIIKKFEMQHHKTLSNWNGYISQFVNTNLLIKEVFYR